MPYTVRKSRRKSGGYDIVHAKTGKMVGHSKTKRKAKASARIRNRH